MATQRPMLSNQALNQSLRVTRKRKELQECLLWGSINIVLLSIIIYDLKNSCPFYKSTLQYIEYAAAIILSINIAYRLFRFLYLYFTIEKVPVTPLQKKLLGVKESDPMYKVMATPNRTPVQTPQFGLLPNMTPVFPPTPSNFGATPMNTTALSWRSQCESPNLSMSSSSWMYTSGSPMQQQSSATPPRLKPRDTSGIDEIKNEDMLSKYLQDFEKNEKEVNDQGNVTQDQSSSWLSTFWSYPISKTKDLSPFLRRNEYQLSQQTPDFQTESMSCPIIVLPCHDPDFQRDYTVIRAATNSPKTDDKGSPLNQSIKGMETWRRLQVDSRSLTQWNENLRKWLSQTILDRLVAEISTVDAAFQAHGLTEITIGQVGLDRLRKTAQMAPVIQYIPTLSALIPFLELTTNQEYLVKRIKELTKGGCMSEFKWNGGSKFHGKEWDHNLPTDSAIIMHLFASYMDTQLMPAPNKPDAKPFTTFHYIKFSDKVPDLTQYSMAIQEASINPPHFRVIVGSEVFEIVKGYNNLFHSILLFLYHVNKKDHGMLGRVNLGKAGLNMLWIINS